MASWVRKFGQYINPGYYRLSLRDHNPAVDWQLNLSGTGQAQIGAALPLANALAVA
jgi:hypothetical protein